MDIKTIGALIAILVGSLTAWKIIGDLIIGHKVKSREQYRFAKEFLNDLGSEKTLHPYAIAKGYRALAGVSTITPQEVHYILELENSEKLLTNYVLARPYLRYLDTRLDSKISFNGRYTNATYRVTMKWLFGALYFILAFLAMSPLFALPFAGLTPQNALYAFLITFPVFGSYAVWSLRISIKIRTAEEVVSNQVVSRPNTRLA
jgi:hypothetical protein